MIKLSPDVVHQSRCFAEEIVDAAGVKEAQREDALNRIKERTEKLAEAILEQAQGLAASTIHLG